MEITTIYYFTTLVKCKSFTAASEKLYISQSALSQHMKKLESKLGVNLFDRTKHKMELTEAGKLFYEDGLLILSAFETTKEKIRSLSNPDISTVTFGISPFYSHYYLPILLPPLQRDYPSINCQVAEEISVELERGLVDGAYDFCLVPLQPMNDKLYYDVVFTEEILLAVPKKHPANAFAIPSVGMPFIDMVHLKDANFIMLKQVQKFYEMSMCICMEAGFQPHVIIETINWDTINKLVGNGMGVGFIPEIVVGTLPEEKRPNYYRIHRQRTYAIAWLKTKKLSAHARVVIDNFKASFASTREYLF